ncbi:MAG: four helix bundle protein [Kiritimatiellaeota bacterium]|nr:four helix bundle protein [Kiritimatiellota bacterium]
MSELFDKSGGYRKLYSFTFATMIHLGTIRFCKRFISYRDDPLGKTAGQMIGAARSGRQNIIEASERAATSKQTEIRLTDVARASLAELLGDYEIYLADKGVIPWSRENPERCALARLRLLAFEYTDDSLHDYWRYFQEVKKPFDRWLESDDDTVVANAMIFLITRTMAMLGAQLQHQGEDFLEHGGFRERMHQCRTEARREQTDTVAPPCPECGAPMRNRTSRIGKNAGKPFWGCSNYPNCKGTRTMGPSDPVTRRPGDPGTR